MGRWWGVVVGLVGAVALAGAAPGFEAGQQVPASIATFGAPQVVWTGTELVVDFPYEAKGAASVSFFNPPDGNRFMLIVDGALVPGSGHLTFALPRAQAAGLTEATLLVDPAGARGFVFLRFTQDPVTLAVAALAPGLAPIRESRRAASAAGPAPGPGSAPAAAAAPRPGAQAPRPLPLFEVRMPPALAVMGDPTVFSTGTELVVDFPYESQGTWDAGFSHPRGAFSILVPSGMKKGKGSLAFAVPLARLKGVDWAFFNVETPRVRGEVEIYLKDHLAALPVHPIPADLAPRVLRSSTQGPWSKEKPAVGPDEPRSLVDDLPLPAPGAPAAPKANHDPRLVGRWKDGYFEAQYTFSADGTAAYIEPRLWAQTAMVWSTRNDRVLIVENHSPGSDGKPYEYAYRVVDGKLVIHQVSHSVSGEKFEFDKEYEPYP